MKMKIAIIIILSSVILTAQPGNTRGYYGWSNQLDLTTEQIQQINELRSDYRINRISSQADVAALRLELRQLMIADKPNQRKIDAKLKTIRAKEADIDNIWVQHRLSIRSLLTDEQQVLYDSRSMMGRGGYGRGGGNVYGRGFGACDGSGFRGRR